MNEVVALISRFAQSQRGKFATGGALLLSGVIGYHVMFGPNGTVVYKKKREEYRRLQNEIQDLTRTNSELADRVKALKTDPKAIEREARESMHYARPGEIIYTEPAAQSPSGNTTAAK